MGEIAKRSVGGKTLLDMTSDATATAPDILGGKTAYVKGMKINGSGRTLQAMTADATATGADIFSGKTAYVNGSKITGYLSSLEKANLYLVYSAVVTEGGKNGFGGADVMCYWDDFTVAPNGNLNHVGEHYTASSKDFGPALIGKYCSHGRITNAWDYMGGNVETVTVGASVQKLGYGVTDTPNPFPTERKGSDGNWRINVTSTSPL